MIEIRPIAKAVENPSNREKNIGVMLLGRLCEVADAHDLFAKPQHPYTRRRRLDTIPDLEMTGRERVPGEVPVLKQTESGLVACHAVEEGRIPSADPVTPPQLP